jgi:hypothetical protein
MGPVSFAGTLISIIAIMFAWSKNRTIGRLMVFVGMFFVHIISTIIYYNYSLTNVADAYGYYYFSYLWAGQGFGLGTIFTEHLVRYLKVNLGGSYFDCFIFFQAIGFFGIMILARVLSEIQEKMAIKDPHAGLLALLFIPSMIFWTSAIGKDAPLFFAISLSVWSMFSLRKRLVGFGIALLVMVLFRPHIGLMAAAAVTGATMFGKNVSAGRKLGLFAVSLVALWFGMAAVQSEFGVNVTSASSVTSFLDKQNDIYAGTNGTTSMAGAPYVIRVVSLLFRPFFFDASGGLGFIASFENLIWVTGFIFLVRRWRQILFLAQQVFFIRYVLLFAFFILFSLTLVYYNVGLGLRQRVMAFPMIICIFAAAWSMRFVTPAVPVPVRPPRRSLPGRENENKAVQEL